MKKNILLIAVYFLTTISIYAQNPLVKQWDARFGGNNENEFFSLQQAADGGYFLVGLSWSDSSDDKTQDSYGGPDYWVVKIDSMGNKQWDKDYGGSAAELPNVAKTTADGGLIIGGYAYSGNTGNKTSYNKGKADFWVVKIDSLGTKQWDSDFGGSEEDIIYSLQQTRDGGYILGGSSLSNAGGDKTQDSKGFDDYWVVKIDSLGNKQWDKDFGGADYDHLFSLRQTTDGGYILAGTSWSNAGVDKTQASKGTGDYWIIKIDSLGNKKWDKTIGGDQLDWPQDIEQTPDKGFIVAGYSYSGIAGDKSQASNGNSDYWIVKIDSAGNKKWDKDFGSGNSDELNSMVKTSDGSYLLSGGSYSQAGGDKSENNLGTENTWLVKVDSLGNKQWDKTILTAGYDLWGKAIVTNTNCYVVATTTNSGLAGYVSQSPRGDQDYWIVKFRDTTAANIIKPTSNFLSSDTIICGNHCINFTNLSLHATSLHWTFDGGIPSTDTVANPYVCYIDTGKFNVKLTALNSVGKDSLTLSNFITVEPNPVQPQVIRSNDTLYIYNDPSYAHIQWYDSTTQIPEATDTFFVIQRITNYNVLVSNANGCSARAGVDLVVGFSELKNNEHLILSPNPVSSHLLIRTLVGDWKEIKITVLNTLGQIILPMIALNQKNKLPEMEVSSLPSGIYFLEVTGEKGRWIGKFVKE